MYSVSLSDNTICLSKTGGLPFTSQEKKYLEDLGGREKGISLSYPPSLAYLHRLFDLLGKENFEGDEELVRRWEGSNGFPIERPADHPNFEWTSYRYQVEAGEFLINTPHRGGILSLSPGMGKTMTSITTSDILGCRKILVVAPYILLWNWNDEIRKWSKRDLPRQIYQGENKMIGSGWVITNYEQLGRGASVKDIFRQEWDLIIFDESIRLKSKDARRSKWSAEISSFGKRIWLLSGVPISHDISDLWSQFRVIDKSLFKSFWRFASTYCIVWKAPWGDTISGSKPGIDFNREFRDLMFIRDKSLLGLPPMIYTTVILQMGEIQARVYERAKKEYLLELVSGEEKPILHHLTQIQRLQQIISSTWNVDPDVKESVKVDYLVDMFQNDGIEGPVLIFGFWVNGMLHLRDELKKAKVDVEMIIGDTPQDVRQTIIQRYQSGNLQCLILSYSIGQYGLNLQMTNTLVFFDKVFGSEAHIQAKDRVDRIGRQGPCRVINLNIEGTIDRRIIDALSDKFVDISNLTKAQIIDLVKGAGNELQSRPRN